MICRIAAIPACLTLLCFSPGCSESEKSEPRSVLDSLAEVEKTKEMLTPQRGGTAKAPGVGSYKVKFETSAGEFVVLVHRDWAPLGAQRFYELVNAGFYNDCRFFRVVSDFMVQFGINGDPATQLKWKKPITDDVATQSNQRGYVTFATSGPDSRTTQVFINSVDNAYLDLQGFAPFGEVIEGLSNVDEIYSEYGELPKQDSINARGNEYLRENFPDLDYIRKASIIEE